MIIFGSIHAQDYSVSLKTPAVYNHYHINPFIINPAHTGFEGNTKLIFNFRNHWAGFPDAPKALTFGLNAAPAANMGIGGLIYSENYGAANRFIGKLNYAYQFGNENNKFALGLGGSYIQYSLDNAVFTDPYHQSPDPIINNSLNGRKFFSADLGFWGEFSKKYKIGIALPHLIETSLDNKNSSTTTPKEDKPIGFVALVGAIYEVPSYRITLEPSIGLRKISDVPFGTDLNIIARMLDDKLFGGFTYSFGPSWHRIMFLGGARVDRFRFYYSYDQSYLDFQNYNNGSHELTLSFDLFKISPKAKATMEEPAMDKEMMDK